MFVFTLAALVRSTTTPWLQTPLRSGDVPQASALAQRFLDDAAHADHPALAVEIATCCGDLMLAQDRDEDAEECYRRAIKAAAGHGARGTVRVLSCRNTGFMNLYQQRLGTAAACFRRVVDDDAATPLQRVESLCGLALAHHGMGQKTDALNCLHQAADQAAKDGTAPLVMMASVLRTDLRVRHDIRAHSELQDHVFWQLPHQHAASAQETAHPLVDVEACLVAYEPLPLIARHLKHLRALILASCGDTQGLHHAQQHLAWLRHAHLAACERQERLETSLVAIVLRDLDVARGALEPLCRGQQRWNFEVSYCLARVCAMSGRGDESLKHYQRYALESVQCVRAETTSPMQGTGMPYQPVSAPSAVRDDVEMALPAKYRRAYRYMLEHLKCPSLSVREIADAIGVTERALQAAFKAALGMSPAEVLRRARLERIRQDLLQGDASRATVIETASRWGIQNRSTLVSLYRKHFRETPAQTLSREAA